MNKFSIKDIENLTGIKAHTIRIWEQRYNILQPKRTPTNIRYYDADDLKMALRISMLNAYGYKISRIHQMSDAEMTGLISKIGDRDFRLKSQVNDLLECALALDVDRFEEQIDNYIRRNGMEATIEVLVFSFLEKIGLMWMTDRLVPAQEHLAANVIFRKIAVAIEKISTEYRDEEEIVLFLPEGEIHDIGLFYVYYLLRKAGRRVLYLGANTPLEDVQAVSEVREIKNVYVHLTASAATFNPKIYLQRLADSLPKAEVWVSGAVLTQKKLPDRPRFHYLYTLGEVREKLVSGTLV